MFQTGIELDLQSALKPMTTLIVFSIEMHKVLLSKYFTGCRQSPTSVQVRACPSLSSLGLATLLVIGMARSENHCNLLPLYLLQSPGQFPDQVMMPPSIQRKVTSVLNS